MNISEFNSRKSDAKKAASESEIIRNAVSEIVDLVETIDKDDKILTDVRTKASVILMANKHMSDNLDRYNLLLDDIASKTRINWPPSCVADTK